jgi:uncharacterized protein (DUF486 family)
LPGRAGKPLRQLCLQRRPAQTIQEVITLSVFAVFSVVYLQQAVTWNQAIGFALIALGAFFVFRAPI